MDLAGLAFSGLGAYTQPSVRPFLRHCAPRQHLPVSPRGPQRASGTREPRAAFGAPDMPEPAELGPGEKKGSLRCRTGWHGHT